MSKKLIIDEKLINACNTTSNIIFVNKSIINMKQQEQQDLFKYENLMEICQRSKYERENLITWDNQGKNLILDPQKILQQQGEQKQQKNYRTLKHKQDERFKNVFKQKKNALKGGNTPRKLLQMAIQHLTQSGLNYTSSQKRMITRVCKRYQDWRLLQKNNVFNLADLSEFFVSIDRLDPNLSLKNRRNFSKILRTHGIDSMRKPRSQIHQREHYLKTMKIYAIRCRSKILMLRNQSR